MSASAIEEPRSPAPQHSAKRSNRELYGWIFMRVSGAILIVLIFGHLFVNLMTGRGIHAIDFAFVGGKWTNPVWQIWDLLMLWLAMLHGTNGVRTIIYDYAHHRGVRITLLTALYVACVVIVVLGTLVLVTFNPCPPNADPALLPSICNA